MNQDPGLTAGPGTVNGKIPGTVWWTDDVEGEVEVMHIGGMKAVRPIVDAWFILNGDNISVGARTRQPIIDGMQRKNYWMSHMRGNLATEFPDHIQTIVRKTAILCGAESIPLSQVRTATIVLNDDKSPIVIMFNCVSYTMYENRLFEKHSFNAKFR